jgi:hypothetical protein
MRAGGRKEEDSSRVRKKRKMMKKRTRMWTRTMVEELMRGKVRDGVVDEMMLKGEMRVSDGRDEGEELRGRWFSFSIVFARGTRRFVR